MKKKTKKLKVSKEAAQEFVGGFELLKAEERGKAPKKLGIQFRAFLSRNVSALKPMSDEMDEAVIAAQAQGEEVKEKYASRDDDGNPIELPGPQGSAPRYKYDVPIKQINDEIKALGLQDELDELGSQEEEVEIHMVKLEDFPEDIEHLFEAFKVMIDDL